MTQYIYSRVSTEGQSVEPQLLPLKQRYPEARIVSEVASGGKTRPMLTTLVGTLQSGDTLIVAALDRLGRKTVEILGLIEDLKQRGVILISVREGVDYSTPAGRLVTQILVSVAELERSLIRERTKVGLAAARAKGRVGGRPSVIPEEVKSKAIQKVQSGASIKYVSSEMGISYSYLWKLCRCNIASEPHGEEKSVDSSTP